ncbi:MAG: hypothetical protein ACP5NP_00765 [Acetobacteraceae bacterium]
MTKIAVHIFHDDPSALGSGSHVAERMRQITAQSGVPVEVYVFGPAEKALADPARDVFNATIDGLIAAGVPVGTCIDIADGMGQRASFAARGLRLEYARDAFVRLAREGATVISF